MLKKSFVLMILLAASLIGISSATNHQPEVTVGQPQPQQPLQPQQPQQPIQPQQSQQSPQQQQQQLQSPNTAPPTLGKRPAAPQGLQQQQSNVGTLVQIQQDKALVDRLLPWIIQKIDGKVLAQKIDTETLINKIGGKRLAQIVVENTELKFGTEPRESSVVDLKKSGPAPPATHHEVVATCPPGSKITGGGVVIMTRGEKGQGLFAGPADNQIIESRYGNLGNTWLGTVRMESSGSFYTQAVCAWPSLRVLK